MFVPNEGLTVKTLSSLPLVRDREDEIRDLLSGRVLTLFLDYDGTLTPIVEDYTKAFLAEDMRAAVAEIARHCTVSIVSGRDVDHLRRLVRLDSVFYAGSHGFEIAGPVGRNERLEKGVEFLPVLDDTEEDLRSQLVGIPGHAVERKRFSIAVHYRRAADEDVGRIEAIVDEVLSRRSGLQKRHGKKVFRIQPNIEWDKGHAVLWLLDRLGLDQPVVLPVYVGDDITDEDAFRALIGRGFSIVVRDGDPRPTAADYAVANPEEVRHFLELVTAIARNRDPREGRT